MTVASRGGVQRMSKSNMHSTRVVGFMAAVIMPALVSSACGRSGGRRPATVPEATLRAMAVHTVAPEYPRRSAEGTATGVVVAQITVATDGRVAEVDLLEAPDEEIGRAVEGALTQWSFTPMTLKRSGERVNVQGKLTFYCRIENGLGRIRAPEELGPQASAAFTAAGP